jgi:putative membrane protein
MTLNFTNVIIANAGHEEVTGSFWSAWPREPLLWITLLGVATLYGLGWSRLHHQGIDAAVPTWRVRWYGAALLSIGAALLSPIAVFSERLFAIHMVQHLLLLLIAPPLIWLGAPLLPMLWALPTSWRRAVASRLGPGRPLYLLGHALAHPVVAVVAYVTVVAIWHVPRFYDAAQGRTVTHDLEHICFFGTALLFWWPIIYPAQGRRRLSYGMAIPYLVPPFLEGMLIGILVTFADRPLYQTYVEMESTWGLSVLDDQQLGGLIMWVPGGMFFLIPLLGLLARLLHDEEHHQDRTARFRMAPRTD